MRRCVLATFAALLAPPALAAEVRVDQYDRKFNAAADKLGVPFRLTSEVCAERMCNFGGDQGITAIALAEKPKAALQDSMIRIPAAVSTTEFAAIVQATLQMFSPEHSAEARQTFATTLAAQLARDGSRAEGQLGGWVYVLRYDRGEQWRVVVRKPDA